MSETPLRIALVAPVAAPLRPGGGDSVEQLVGTLAEALVARGQEVTVYATGNSDTAAHLRSVHAGGYDEEDKMWDWFRHESFHAAAAFEQAREFDVIHSHDFHFTLPFSRLTATPLIETAHVELAPEILLELKRRPEVHLVTVSGYAAREVERRPNHSVIPHGIDFDSFELGAGDGGYLLFLGRLIADKGPADAVRIAAAAGLPLVLAGPAQEDYDLAAEVDLQGVECVGWVDAAERQRLLAGARALLFPNRYGEPFGLVLLEAMACGTPVLGTAVGATPEIVDEGITGYTAPGWEGLAGRTEEVARLDRRRVREHARSRFSVQRMVDAHLALYRSVAR
jgi:glycosyltransferase involved in cell wall biosynthesis